MTVFLFIVATLEALQNTRTGRAVVDALTGHKNGAAGTP